MSLINAQTFDLAVHSIMSQLMKEQKEKSRCIKKVQNLGIVFSLVPQIIIKLCKIFLSI